MCISKWSTMRGSCSNRTCIITWTDHLKIGQRKCLKSQMLRFLVFGNQMVTVLGFPRGMSKYLTLLLLTWECSRWVLILWRTIFQTKASSQFPRIWVAFLNRTEPRPVDWTRECKQTQPWKWKWKILFELEGNLFRR